MASAQLKPDGVCIGIASTPLLAIVRVFPKVPEQKQLLGGAGRRETAELRSISTVPTFEDSRVRFASTERHRARRARKAGGPRTAGLPLLPHPEVRGFFGGLSGPGWYRDRFAAKGGNKRFESGRTVARQGLESLWAHVFVLNR